MTWPVCMGDPARQKQKIRYPTADIAKAKLLDTRIAGSLRRNQNRHEASFYWCKFCGGYHLTSKTRN